MDEELGPKMLACDERERKFVRAMLDYPTATQAKWARLAGYGGPNQTSLSMRVNGHFLAHRPRILEAVREETWKRVQLGGAIAVANLVKIATDPGHKGHQKACEALADRAGYAAVQKIDVKHEHIDMTGEAIRKEIERLAAKVGVPLERLYGPNVIEGDFTEVKGD